MPKTPAAPRKLTADQKVEKALNAQTAETRRKIEKRLSAYAQKRIRKDLNGDEETADQPPLSDAAQAAMKAAARILQPYGDEITQGDLDYVGEVIGAQDTGDADMDPASPIDMELDDKRDEAVDAKEIDKESDDGDDDKEGEDRDKTVEMADDDPPVSPPDDAGLDDDSGDEDDDPGEMDDDDPAGDDDDTPVNIALPADSPDGVDDADHQAATQAAREAYVSTLEATGYKVAKRHIQKRARTNDDMKLKAVIARIEKRAAKAEAELAVERNARLDREYRSRAESEFGALGEPEKVAKSLRHAHEKLGKEAADELENVLRAANSRIRKAAEYGGDLLSEIGHSRPGSSADSGEGRIQSMTEELIQKAVCDHPGKPQPSRAQVARQVLKSKEGRAEYARYRATR